MAVIGDAFLIAMGRADAAIHVQHHHVGGAADMNGVDPPPHSVSPATLSISYPVNHLHLVV